MFLTLIPTITSNSEKSIILALTLWLANILLNIIYKRRAYQSSPLSPMGKLEPNPVPYGRKNTAVDALGNLVRDKSQTSNGNDIIINDLI